MSKKFSSFDQQQLIMENFRKFINENETTEDGAGDGIAGLVRAVHANSIKDLSYLTDEGKKGFVAGLKYISKNGYKPEEGDYQKLVHYANVSNETLAWKNGFKDAAIQWDDFMEDKNIKSDGRPGLEDFKKFKEWLDAWEEREQRRLEDEEALDYDDY